MADDPRSVPADARLEALFPAPGSLGVRPRRRRRTAVVGALVVLVVVAVVAATAAFGSSGPDYRVATVGPQQVDSVLTSVATIEPVAQATVAFPAAGTVASVNVKVGDAVTAGGVLASLDTQSLQDALHTKQNTLAQAQLTLSKALSGESVGAASSGGSSFGASSGNGASATTSSYRTGGSVSGVVLMAADITDPTLAADQQAVLTAQQQVDAAINAADAAITAETTACSPFVTPPDPPPVTPPDPTACQQAITAVQTAQQQLADAQHALATASTTLDTLLGTLAAAPPATPSAPTSSGGGAGNGTQSGGGGSAGGSDTSGSSGGGFGSSSVGGTSRSSASGASGPTAADLVSYQAAVDAASDGVAAAQQSVDAATIASPLTGTVVGVNMKVGDAVSAGSSTENVVIQGQGGYEIATSVSVDDIPSVSIGQAATVLPDGSHDGLAGRVVGIAVVPATSTTTTAVYHVIVGLTNPAVHLHDGATGTVSIVTKQTRAALAVPTSSLTTTGNRHTVTVMRDGKPTIATVQTGVIGSAWAEVTGGVHAGDEVVLADASAALPGSATASSGTSTGLTNGQGGG
ncbi:MAG TPA: biotin/lipoyl-binding protein, partial [Gaiellaceae bacterium]|nr:biotin/lipoyl-binding protein [Gaiellaceae bacterium]